MRKKSILLLEVFIWILLLGGLVFLGINLVKQKLDSRENYQVIFKDVDNLMVGAPVRIMGIDVGYATEIKPVEDRVYVTFVITNEEVSIPSGATVNIQFTGLAGAKSIEIIPPKYMRPGPHILRIEEPIRVNSLVDINNQISQSILDSSENALKVFGKGGVDVLKENIKKASKSTNDLTFTLKNGQNFIKETNDNIFTGSDYVRTTLENQSKTLDDIYTSYFDRQFSEETKNKIKLLSYNVQFTSQVLDNDNLKRFKSATTRNLKKANKNINKLNHKVQNTGNMTINVIKNNHKPANVFLFKINNMLESAKKFFDHGNIREVHKKSDNLKKTTEVMNKEI